jgi:hypothetical protein
LQTEENAGPLQNGSFPFSVSAEEKIKAGSELNPERLKTTEIPELNFGEHEDNDESMPNDD